MVPMSFFYGLSVILVAVVHRHDKDIQLSPAFKVQIVRMTEMSSALKVCMMSAPLSAAGQLASSLTLVKATTHNHFLSPLMSQL